MLTGSPLSATNPTIPVPHGIRISSFFSISINVDLEHTSKSLETRQRPRGVWPRGSGVQPPPFSPCTRNREPRSACKSIDTFCKILWQSERTSNSLQISFTCKENRIWESIDNWADIYFLWFKQTFDCVDNNTIFKTLGNYLLIQYITETQLWSRKCM